MKVLVVNGKEYPSVNVRDFRERHNLPPYWGVALFCPPQPEGAASLTGRGPQMASLRERVLEAVEGVTWEESVHLAARKFYYELHKFMSEMGFKSAPKEIVAAFYDSPTLKMPKFMRPPWERHIETFAFLDLLFGLITRYNDTKTLDLDEIHAEWFRKTAKTEPLESHFERFIHPFEYISIVKSPFGREGLFVNNETFVLDTTYICPAERFSLVLIREVAAKIVGEE